MTKGVIVELFGLPGAGKTHLMHEITGRLRADGVTVKLAIEAIPKRRFCWAWLVNGLSARAWVALHPSYCRQLSQLLTRTGQLHASQSKKLFWAWVKTLARRDRLRRRNVLTLQDHGCWQLLWSIGYEAEPSRWREILPVLAGYVLPADMLVVVDTCTSVACQRLVDRGELHGVTSRLQAEDLSREGIRERLDGLLCPIVDQINDQITQRGLRVMRVDNTHSKDTDENVGAILDHVRRLLP